VVNTSYYTTKSNEEVLVTDPDGIKMMIRYEGNNNNSKPFN